MNLTYLVYGNKTERQNRLKIEKLPFLTKFKTLGDRFFLRIRVKSSIFGQTAKFGQPPCLFHSSIIGIKNKLTKQTVKILMRRL